MTSAIYGLATLATRLLMLVTTVVVTHLLAPNELGAYVLSVTTAFALSYLFGSWLSASAYRYIAGSSSKDQEVTLSCLVVGLLIVIPLAVLAGYWLYVAEFLILSPLNTFFMCCSIVVMMMFDLTIAVKNSMGKAIEFALAGIIRNVATLALLIIAIWSGFGAEGALFAHVLGVLFGLATPSTLITWCQFRFQKVSWQRLQEFFVYGLVGGPVLGYYMISNAINRNIISNEVNAAMAGVFGISFDLLFGPIALIGASLSYIHMPRMHASSRHKSREDLQSSTKAFLNPILIFTTPYVFGGVIVGGELLSFVAGRDIRYLSQIIAPYAVVYAGAMSIFSAVIGAMLVGRHLVGLMILILTSLLASGGAVFWASHSADAVLIAQAAAGVMTLSMLVGLWFGNFTGAAQFSSLILFKVLGLSILMTVVVGVLISLPQPYGLFLSISAGIAIYVTGMEVLGLFPVLQFANGFFKSVKSRLMGS